MNKTHALLDPAYKNRNLRGHILLNVVYLQEAASDWSGSEKQHFEKNLREVTDFLREEGLKEKVSVRFTVKSEDLRSGSQCEAPPDIDRIHAKAHGFESVFEFENELKRVYSADEIVTVFVLPGLLWRAYQCGNYIVVDKKAKPFAIMHETLHTFGARDYYLPARVNAIAKEYFPQSVFLSGSWKIHPGSIDSLTRHLIGWQKVPDSAAQSFLDETKDLTSVQINTAKILSRNTLVNVFRRSVPYASFEAIRKDAARKDPWGCFLQGLCQEKGIYTDQDRLKAEEFYWHAWGGDCAPAGYRLVELKLSRNQLTESDRKAVRRILAGLADQPYHMLATSLYACCLYTGFGLDSNRAEARKIVSLNFSHYGYSNHNEHREFRQLPKTVQQHKLLARLSQGLPELHGCVNEIAETYLGIEKKGDEILFYLMGRLLSDEGHSHPDLTRAFELYLKAAQDGLSVGCKAVADCYRKGIGTQVNPAAAERWTQEAAKARAKEDSKPETRLHVRILNSML